MAPSLTKSQQKENELFALVRWLNGNHAGEMTPNLSTRWIRRFDPDHVDLEESYTVEWRKPPMPKSGWPLYDCEILEVSGDIDFLRQKMNALLEASDEDRLSITETPTSREPQFLRDILNTIRSSLSNSGMSQGQGQRNISSSSSTPGEKQNVKKVGTALVLSTSSYICANAARSPSAMTMTLVRAAFSKRRLRRSSYAGQKRKDTSKPGLKQYRKMQDIQDFVKTRFPYFSQAAFGSAVNSCTGKNVDRERVVTLRDESESEDESY